MGSTGMGRDGGMTDGSRLRRISCIPRPTCATGQPGRAHGAHCLLTPTRGRREICDRDAFLLCELQQTWTEKFGR